tara:strand:- start:36251 stop:36805 length:555 start_codon:yes stop_codon:yes gene_type:complete
MVYENLIESNKMTNEFKEALKIVLEELTPKAKSLAEGSERAVTSCISSLMLPHIKQHFNPTTAKAIYDNRKRKWNVQLTFLVSHDATQYELTAESGVEVVNGYSDAIKLMRDYVADVHADQGVDIDELEDFSEENLRHRFNSLRPAISRGGGRARMVTQYVVNEHHYSCVLRVSHEHIPLDIVV